MNETIFSDFKKGKLESFYGYCYPALLTYATRLLGDEQAFLAEDCTQNAIYKTYEHRELFESYKSMINYAYTSIHHEVISIHRHILAHDNFLKSTEEDDENAMNIDLLDSLVEQEVLDILYAAINDLPPRLYRIFQLSFEQGLKNSEIAERLNISVSAVKKQKVQLVEKLREVMDSALVQLIISHIGMV